LKKVLIANRGEIAVRVIRTCRDVGLATVAVYSTCDRNALHVRLADEAYAIGPDEASESYLRVEKLIDVAKRAGATAVHPGYGFLSENPEFAEACSRAGLIFIGPSAAQMRSMGSKTSARAIAARVGVGVVPGTDAPFGPDASDQELARAAEDLGFPLLVKAVAGGGGKGMRVVHAIDGLSAAVALSRSEASSAFGDARVYFERQLDRPRHIEVQLLGDRHGNVTAFAERECSIQRRHQKLIEETPSAAVTPELREKLMVAAEAIGRAAGYTSAGTIEFLVDAAGQFYFLEMNTRLQVEHPVTEAVTGLDLVRAQIDIAQGKTISELVSTDLGPTVVGSGFSRTIGHAIEVRIYAEDPLNAFLPSPGRITHLRAPAGPGIRIDSGAYEGWVVPTTYDPMVSKVIAWAPDRQGAIARMVRALGEYDVRGIATTIAFCRELVASPAFAATDFDTTTVDRMVAQGALNLAQRDEEDDEMAAIAAALWEVRNGKVRLKPDTTGAAKVRLKPDTTDAATSVVSAFRRTADSLWAQRARIEGLR
jgi:acetyl-CoA carboxylase biotin carboxylase subunit